MSGIGSVQLLRLATSQVELPESVDDIVEAVRSILNKGDVQSVIIKSGEPIVYQRMSPSSEDGTPQDPLEEWTSDITLKDMCRNVEMEEFNLSEQGLTGAAPQTVMFWAIYFLEHEGYVPTHILVSKESDFWPWLGIGRRTGRKTERFMGLRVERDEALPSSSVVLFGSDYPGAGVREVRLALKVTAEAPNARTNRETVGNGGNTGAGHKTA